MPEEKLSTEEAARLVARSLGKSDTFTNGAGLYSHTWPDSESEHPWILRTISVGEIDKIYETLKELRVLYPEYRDDQLFVFWLGRLSQGTSDLDIHDFDSSMPGG